MEDHGESEKQIATRDITQKQVDNDLSFLKNFKATGGHVLQEGRARQQNDRVAAIRRLNPGMSEDEAQMRFAMEQQRERSKREPSNLPPSNVTEPKQEDSKFVFQKSLVDRLKSMGRLTESPKKKEEIQKEKIVNLTNNIMAAGRYAYRENKLIPDSATARQENINEKPDLKKLADKSPDRYHGRLGKGEDEWRIAWQGGNKDTQKRETLTINIDGQDRDIRVAHSMWMVPREGAAVRYILADTGEWFVGAANSKRYDKKQNMEFWTFLGYKKADESDIQNVLDVLTNLNPMAKAAKAA